MKQRTKRLILLTAKNLLIMIACVAAFLISIFVLATVLRFLVITWGTGAALSTFGVTIGIVALLILALLKARDDLKLAEFKEKRVMDKLRMDDNSYWERFK